LIIKKGYLFQKETANCGLSLDSLNGKVRSENVQRFSKN